MADDINKIKSAKTVEGSEVKIDTTKGIKVNEATVSTADIISENGVIHIIDIVLVSA